MAAQSQSTFIYEITLYDAYKHRSMWTDREFDIQRRHIAYLDQLTQAGKLELAGIIDQGLEAHQGFVILRVGSYGEARELAMDDPSVKEGMMQVRLRPVNVYFKGQ